MNYQQALRHARGAIAGRPCEVVLLSGGTLQPVVTYLRALGAVDGVDYRVSTQGDAGLVAAFHAAPRLREAAMVLVVAMVEDVFPELSYRGPSDWTVESLREVFAEAASRIDEFSAWMVDALRGCRRSVVLVPAAIASPPLFPAEASALTPVGALALRLRAAVAARAVTVPGVVVADPERVFAGLEDREIRSGAMLLQAGAPFSPSAAERVAQLVHGRFVAPPAPRKLLITDLDDTLWRGILGDDGPANLSSHAGGGDAHAHHVYQGFLRLLRSEGVVLAAVSRNSPDVVRRFFRDADALRRAGVRLAESDFATMSCAWSPKSQQVRTVCDRLGLTPAAAVMVDDNELELVEACGGVPGLAALRFPDGGGLHAFLARLRELFPAPATTREDAERSRLYEVRDLGERDRPAFGSSEEFLQQLQLRAAFALADGAEPRPFQLHNKTNQFNLTGVRLDRADWDRLLGEGTWCVRGELRDRHGDHGTVLVALVDAHRGGLEIRNLTVSCRVLGRGMESAFLEWLVTRSRQGSPRVTAFYRATGTNDACAGFLEKHGFRPAGTRDGCDLYALEAPVRPAHFVAWQ